MSRKARRESLTPDLTPLIDVVFLLLIFFLVSSVFKKEELALLLQLPKSEKGAGKTSDKMQLTIELSDNDIAVNGKKVQIEYLAQELQGKDPKTLIDLRVDGKVPYNRLVKVLDALQKNKLENVSLITEKEKAP
jgi:biopolymer transport protein ExbD